MPSLDEFLGPKPTKEQYSNLEKIIGTKPCFKCDKDSTESFWDPSTLIMTWTCPDGHANNVKVN
jgi:hypothetical protein